MFKIKSFLKHDLVMFMVLTVGLLVSASSFAGVTSDVLGKGTNLPVQLYQYDQNYVIHTYSDKLNTKAIQSESWAENKRNDETKYQFSFAFPVIKSDKWLLGASYTQKALWQSTNFDESAPFRDINHEPQVFVGYKVDKRFLKDVEVGFNHQSNGRSGDMSRSWNRAYTKLTAGNDTFEVFLKPYVILGTNDKYLGDNRDIAQYLGYYQAGAKVNFGKFTLSNKFHYNWNTTKGNSETGLAYQLNDTFSLYGQVFNGYGETLIDYNHYQNRYGAGIALNF